MKKNQFFTASLLVAFIVVMCACKKAKTCRTCKATNTYTLNVVATQEVCTDEAEAEFKFTYNSYPTTAKCE